MTNFSFGFLNVSASDDVLAAFVMQAGNCKYDGISVTAKEIKLKLECDSLHDGPEFQIRGTWSCVPLFGGHFNFELQKLY